MRTSDTLSHLRALDWLKPDTPHIWSLGNSPECRRAARDGSLKPAAVPRMGTWGIAQGGWCLTQMVKPEPGVGEGCSLSEILVPDAPERYFLPEKQVEKLLYRAASQASPRRKRTRAAHRRLQVNEQQIRTPGTDNAASGVLICAQEMMQN